MLVETLTQMLCRSWPELYKKVEDAFVEKFIAVEGESVKDAKTRLENNRLSR